MVMLQNAAWHSEVKKELETVGFEKILTAPLQVYTDQEKQEMQAFEFFWENDFFEEGFYETVTVPVEDIWREKGEWKLLKDYSTIMDYGMGREADVSSYCEVMGRSDEIFLEERKRLVQRLERLYLLNRDYFQYAAIHAEWLGDHWRIVDGFHRASFLYCMGEKTIALRGKKEDAKCYKKFKR